MSGVLDTDSDLIINSSFLLSTKTFPPFTNFPNKSSSASGFLIFSWINLFKGLAPKILSYPFGESNKGIQELVSKLGYEIAFSQHSSPLHIDENKFNLPRFAINDEFGTMKRFKQIVNSKPLIIEDLRILKKNIALGELEISFKLLENSENVNCYINNNAIIKRKSNKNSVNLQFYNLIPQNRYRLNCTLFDRRGELYWLGKMMIVTEMDIIF